MTRRSPASAPGSAAPPSARARWTEHAVAQLAAVAEYVSLSSLSMPNISSTASRIVWIRREFPMSGRVVPEFGWDEIRELIEWPYRLVYRVHGDAIEVLSVLHGRQELRELR